MHAMELVVLFEEVGAVREGLYAGHARRCITPMHPMLMLGYASRSEPFEAVHDDLYCDAVALEHEERLLILTLDLCWMDLPEVDLVKNAISQETGLSSDQQIINFSHTHSGPNVAWFEGVSPDHEYMAGLVKSCTDAAKEALTDLSPAFMSTAEASAHIGCNRRERNSEGRIILGVNPEGQHLDAVTCWHLHRYGVDDILMFTHPVHGTTLGGENMMISAEWMGIARGILEERMPNTVAVFLQGCGADQNPYREDHSFDTVQAHAETVADAISAIDTWQTVKSSPVLVKSLFMDLPLEDGTVAPCPIHGARIGDCVLMGLGGEAFVEYALYARAHVAETRNLMMLGYTDGSVGYLPTAIAYEEGGYEPNSYRMFRIGKSWTPAVERVVKRKIDELRAFLEQE